MTLKRYTTYLAALLMTVFAISFVSCSDETNEENSSNGKMVTVNAVISSRGNITTRSTYVDAANNNELINDWIIVIAKGGIVKKVIKREDYKKSYAVEKEAFEFTIEAGTYDVYSFANIDASKIETAVGSTFLTEGSTLPTLSSSTIDITSIISNGIAVGGLGTINIPMSGYKQATFTAGGNQTEEFEVIRMVAKIEFTYRNSSSKDITLKYIKMNPVNKGLISLLPDYTTLTYNTETNPILLTTGVSIETVTDTYPTGVKLQANSYSSESYIRGFYLRESLAESNPSGLFTFGIGIVRDGKPEEVLYTLSDETFTGINRNDYVKVPIRFSDYIVGLDVNFYPPIGGYPAVVSEDKDKEEFYCTFATQGEFEISPTVFNASTGTNVYYPNWDYNSTTITVSDPNGLFNSGLGGIAPHIDTTTGEILGKLSTAEGTAIIDVEIKVKTGGGVDQLYKRRIYIIRKN